MTESLRVALLSYRSKPHCGGQGEYVRHLSRELVALGHRVEVFSGQPYPVRDPGVRLTEVPSLDLYREPDPFRRPKLHESRDRVDWLEFALMCTGAFPEPLTFTLRMKRILKRRRGEFDIVHDNQSLGSGLGSDAVATVHHPLTMDRRIELAAAADGLKRIGVRRWYSIVRMQGRVARRLAAITTVSSTSRDDIVRDFRVPADRITVVPVGADQRVFRPSSCSAPVPGRLVVTASADVPLKGVAYLLEAVAKLRTERNVSLVVVGSAKPGGATDKLLDKLGLRDVVEFRTGLSDEDLAALIRSAEVAVEPSLYEGFCLPAVEAMSCGVPLVATPAGAVPEIVGPPDECAVHVPPGDAGLLATAIARLLDDPDLRRRLGRNGLVRATEKYSWRATAERTADWYRKVLAAC